MTNQEKLEQAMLNRKTVSFSYNRLGKMQSEEIGNAHIILLSNQFGKKTVTVELPKNNHALLGWKSFDLGSISKVEIIN